MLFCNCVATQLCRCHECLLAYSAILLWHWRQSYWDTGTNVYTYTCTHADTHKHREHKAAAGFLPQDHVEVCSPDGRRHQLAALSPSAMLAALVRATAEEVAWEGSPGISWPQLLSRLQKAGLQVDSQARTLLWTELAAGKSGVFVRGKGKAEPQVEDLPEVDSDNPEKPKSKRCSGSKILLDMPDEMRSHYLQLDAHPDLAENEISKGALQLVAKSRAKGCCGATLSAKLGVSSRDLFYPLEGLRTAGLVIGVLLLTRPKGSADGSSGQNPAGGMQGNIFFFSRFFDPDRVEQTQIQMLLKSSSITMQNHVLSVLKLNPSNVAFESDLRAILGQTVEESSGGAAIPRRTIGKIYHRIRADLVSKGDVECVRAWDPKTSNLRDALCIPGKAAGTQKVEPVLAITEGKEDERPAVQRQRGVADHLPSSLPVPPASKATLRVAGRSFAQQAEDLIRCRFPRICTASLCFFWLCWGPLCFALARQQNMFLAGVLVPAKVVVRLATASQAPRLQTSWGFAASMVSES